MWLNKPEQLLSSEEIRGTNISANKTIFSDSLCFKHDPNDHNFQSRMRGFFVAPSDSEYKFCLKGNSRSEFWLSEDPENPQNMVCHTDSIFTYIREENKKEPNTV